MVRGSAAVFLWYAILTHQYQYNYIYSYSNNSLRNLGIFQLASSFWGGQEGSFMLWLLLTSIVGIILQSYSSKRGDLEPRVMAVFTLATSFLLVMVSPWFKNPFEYIWAVPTFVKVEHLNSQFFSLPFIQQFYFTDQSTNQSFIQINSQLVSLLSQAGVSVNQFIIDGKGLNPQLLNFWMQIHPPILFSGFSMATVPFAFAIAALMKNDYKDYDVRVSVLGHLQRGGSPSAMDRVNASRLGHAAVEALIDDQKSVMVGMMNGEITLVPFRRAVKLHKDVNHSLVELARILSV